MKRHAECPSCHRQSLNTYDPIGVPIKLYCVCGTRWFEPPGMGESRKALAAQREVRDAETKERMTP